jgi:hypothetical protein
MLQDIHRPRCQDHCLAQGRNRTRIIIQVEQNSPQLETCLSQLRIQCDGTPRGVRRRRMRSKNPLGPREVGQRLRKVGHYIQRACDECDRLINLAALLQNDTQQVQRVRLIWIMSKNGAVARFCEIEPPGLMLCQGGFKGLFDVKVVRHADTHPHRHRGIKADARKKTRIVQVVVVAHGFRGLNKAAPNAPTDIIAGVDTELTPDARKFDTSPNRRWANPSLDVAPGRMLALACGPCDLSARRQWNGPALPPIDPG